MTSTSSSLRTSSDITMSLHTYKEGETAPIVVEGHFPHSEKSIPSSLEYPQSEPVPALFATDNARNIAVRYQLETKDISSFECTNPSPSSLTPIPKKIVISWPQDDPENPYNWSSRKKIFVTLVGCTTVLNSTLGSALPSNAIPFIMEDFGISSETQQPLPISVFILGYVLGPLLFGPISEHYGRRTIFISTFLLVLIFTMACALAPNWPTFLFFRALTGVFASSPIVVTGGLYADIYNDSVARGRAMALFMAITLFGPVFAPIISGFITPIAGWRWTFWIGLIIGVVSLPPVVFLPETSGPVLLARRAAHLRRTTSNLHIFAPHELSNQTFRQLVTVVLTRPIRMILFEPIVFATCLYLSLAYSIFYIYFEAYPIIFQGIYGMSPGVSGLMFLPIVAGCCISFGIFVAYDGILQRAKSRHQPWTRKEESRRLPLACIGGPLHVIAVFWLGWAARENVHWAVPFLAGIPFGMGFVLLFMALLNYITDAYEVFAASAMAATSCSRSLFGAALPFAAIPMYNRLGVAWASSLLGLLSLIMCIVPFVFIHWGETIRRKSSLCMLLAEEREKELVAVPVKHEEG